MWDISQGGGRGFLQGPALLLETIHPAKEGNQVCSGLWCSFASFPVFFAKAFLDVPLPLPHTLPLRLPSHLPVGDGQWVKAGRAGSSCCSRKHQLWGSVVRNPIEIPKTIPKGTLVPFEDFLMHFFLNPHTGRQSHMRCDKVGNYVSLSAHQRTNGRRACPCAAVRVVGRRPSVGTASRGSGCRQQPAPSSPTPPWMERNEAVGLI